MIVDQRFMKRAIELARHGLGNTSPNPMVGAVIIHDGRIIGEGYHRRCGEGHAEVNAVASVKDKSLLKDSTMYVTLEPCSHYGKTPPCSRLIIDSGIPRVAVGSPDPFEKVSGRGIKMLRDAGVEVVTGVLEDECRAINPAFMTAHSHHRPLVTLKWAQSADGYIDTTRDAGSRAYRFSTPLTSALTHRLRSLNDAIMVGARTAITDNPALDTRLWPGRDPLRVVAGSRSRLPDGCKLLTDVGTPPVILGDLCHESSVESYLTTLYDRGVTSLLVEGGARLLRSFISTGLWDYARVEVSPTHLGAGVEAPHIGIAPADSLTIDNNIIFHYINIAGNGVKKP